MVFYNKKFERWINLFIENPLKSWWKGRKYFKFPTISIRFISNHKKYCPYISYDRIGKILDIRSCDVAFKYKYDEICYELYPYIWFCLFRRFGLYIEFHMYYHDEFNKKVCLDDMYWEFLLNCVYEKKPLSKAYSTWFNTSFLYKENNNFINIPIPVVSKSLNKQGIEKIRKELGLYIPKKNGVFNSR